EHRIQQHQTNAAAVLADHDLAPIALVEPGRIIDHLKALFGLQLSKVIGGLDHVLGFEHHSFNITVPVYPASRSAMLAVSTAPHFSTSLSGGVSQSGGVLRQ